MWFKSAALFSLFASVMFQSPTLANVCTYSGSPDEFIQSLNKMDQVSDLNENQEGLAYINCLMKKEQQDQASLSDMENKILDAYSAIIDRDVESTGAAEFDEGMP